jgi:hypothetical protein
MQRTYTRSGSEAVSMKVTRCLPSRGWLAINRTDPGSCRDLIYTAPVPHQAERIVASLEGTLTSAPNKLSSRPKRTRISYLVALAATTYVAFRRERRTTFPNATKFHRKSGGAQWRDLLFLSRTITQTHKASRAHVFPPRLPLASIGLNEQPDSGSK